MAKGCEQLVLLKECQLVVLCLAHDVPMVRHLGITKTNDRLQHYLLLAWDHYLPIETSPKSRLNFPPFELLYVRRVRVPLDITKEAWTAQEREETLAVVHMMEIRERLQEMSDVIKEPPEKAQSCQKVYDSIQSACQEESSVSSGQNVSVAAKLSQQPQVRVGWTLTSVKTAE